MRWAGWQSRIVSGLSLPGALGRMTFKMESIPIQIGTRRRRRFAARASTPPVVVALAVYIFVVIGRVPDAFPSVHLAIVTAGITGVLALLGSNRDLGRLLRIAEPR